jgi:Rrf2 family protein
MGKLIHISEAANIAVHSLALIAASDKLLNVTQIAEILNLSKNHIAKVLQTLTRYNLVTSARGPKGGIRLLKSPEEVNLFDIIEIIDGKIEAEHCRNLEFPCPFADCIFGDERFRIYQSFKEFYKHRTLADFKINI